MKAVILAAGVGKRLWPVTQDRPKCLVEVGGRSLLDRSLEALSAEAIRQAVIVVGYKQELIRSTIGSGRYNVEVSYLANEHYQRGSISSLWRARDVLDDDVIIMDADVLFHRRILQRLVQSAHPTALLMDQSVRQHGEECMVVVKAGRVMALSKQMPTVYDLAGEGVGFLKVRAADCPLLIQSVKRCIDAGTWDMEYEDALRDFFDMARVGFELIGGLPWIEIDFPDDLVRAERDVLPKLQ